jgi:cytochrome c oxidase assembly protein subunit 15
VAAYTYVVVYLGAFVRHTSADRACAGWPLCNGSIVPTLSGKVLNAFAHRAGAALLVLTVAGLAAWSWRLRSSRPDLSLGAAVALGLVLLQALSGAVLVWTHMDLFASLTHAAVIGLFFGALAYLCMHVLPAGAESPSHATESASRRERPEVAPAG